MKKRLLLDTSVAIDLLRSRLPETITNRIKQRSILGEVYINRIVWAEIYQGIKSKREERELGSFTFSCPIIEFDQPCWEKTAQIGRQCVQNGINVPFSDIMIQASAIRHNCELLHEDRHFDLIQEALK